MTKDYFMRREIIQTMKEKCHARFDGYWKSNLRCDCKNHMKKERRKAYAKLAQEMRVCPSESHFKNMNDTKTLLKAFKIVLSWNRNHTR